VRSRKKGVRGSANIRCREVSSERNRAYAFLAVGDSNGKNGECQLKINERKWKREEELTFRRSVLSHFGRERDFEVRD